MRAFARRGHQAGDVARAVADHRLGFLGQRGDDQLAGFTRFDGFQGLGIDDLAQEMVFLEVRPVLGLGALDADARAHDLGQAVDVDGLDAHLEFDVATHLVGPGLGPEHADPERQFLEIDAGFERRLVEHEAVGRRAAKDRGPEVAQQHGLPPRAAARDRNRGRAQALGPVMRAEAASEKPVAVGHVDDVAARGPGCGKGTGHHRGPVADVALGVAGDGGFARGAGGGVDAHDVVLGHGEQAEGVVVAQVLLLGKGQVAHVGQAPDVGGSDAALVEGLPVEGDVSVHPFAQRLEAFELQCLELFPGQGFDVHIENHAASSRDGVARPKAIPARKPAAASREDREKTA